MRYLILLFMFSIAHASAPDGSVENPFEPADNPYHCNKAYAWPSGCQNNTQIKLMAKKKIAQFADCYYGSGTGNNLLCGLRVGDHWTETIYQDIGPPECLSVIRRWTGKVIQVPTFGAPVWTWGDGKNSFLVWICDIPNPSLPGCGGGL